MTADTIPSTTLEASDQAEGDRPCLARPRPVRLAPGAVRQLGTSTPSRLGELTGKMGWHDCRSRLNPQVTKPSKSPMERASANCGNSGSKSAGPPYVPCMEVECITSLIPAVPSRMTGCPKGSL